jgi:hypothetical protein
MKYSDKYLKNLLKKSINETLEKKADMLYNRIKKSEMDEAYGDMEGMGDDTPFLPKGTKFGHSFKSPEDWEGGMTDRIKLKTKKSRLCKGMSTEECLDYILDKMSMDGYESLTDEEKDFLKDNRGGGDLVTEGEMCEQCGSGEMREGECMECGSKSMYESATYDLNSRNEFDYTEEEEETTPFELKNLIEGCKSSMKLAKESKDKVSMNHAKNECGLAMDALEEKNDTKKIEELESFLNESKKLVGKQYKIDKNKNKRIDPEDFKLLHKSKKRKSEVDEEEMEEGNEFSGELAKAKKAGKKTFKVDGKTYPVKESIEYHILDNEGDIIKLNENEVIDLIEHIVKEEKLKSMGKHKGLSTYEKAHKESGKENKEYMKSLGAKMKDYLKDGSKGKFDMNPKTFPKGNGELGKMTKKAFEMSDELEDINYEIAGQQFPIPDEIGYDEKRMEKYFKGDSTTGNAPGGNALDSETNERFNKMRKKNTLKKIKDQSYKRVPQPVFNETSTDDEGKLNLKLETMNERKVNILNEEFNRMKDLFSYNRKTQ